MKIKVNWGSLLKGLLGFLAGRVKRDPVTGQIIVASQGPAGQIPGYVATASPGAFQPQRLVGEVAPPPPVVQIGSPAAGRVQAFLWAALAAGLPVFFGALAQAPWDDRHKYIGNIVQAAMAAVVALWALRSRKIT